MKDITVRDAWVEVFNLEQASRYVGVSIPTLRKLISEPDFPMVTIGKRHLIPRRALTDWINTKAVERKCFSAVEEE